MSSSGWTLGVREPVEEVLAQIRYDRENWADLRKEHWHANSAKNISAKNTPTWGFPRDFHPQPPVFSTESDEPEKDEEKCYT